MPLSCDPKVIDVQGEVSGSVRDNEIEGAALMSVLYGKDNGEKTRDKPKKNCTRKRYHRGSSSMRAPPGKEEELCHLSINSLFTDSRIQQIAKQYIRSHQSVVSALDAKVGPWLSWASWGFCLARVGPEPGIEDSGAS